METILNWREEPIEVAHSKGGTLVVVNFVDNLITTGVSPWPPAEIAQKLYQSRQIRAFEGKDRKAVMQTLGYYSDLQSIHSEDAITWSVFGTLAYANVHTRRAFTKALFDLLRIPVSDIGSINVWLWRRIPHPDTLVSGGPEIDFGIQTEQVVILGEAKWLSSIGKAQGKARDKDQLILRQGFFEKYGKVIFGAALHYVVLSLSLTGGILKDKDIELEHATLHYRDTTWACVSNLEGHPLPSEIRSYLEWKRKNSRAA